MSGVTTNSTNAKILATTLPPTLYFGISAQITVGNANAGDIAILYFNSNWQARITFDDGTGTSGTFEIYDGSGNLISRAPCTDTTGGTYAICVAKASNSSAGAEDYKGNSVNFNSAIGAYPTVTTLQLGFGTGATNTGGLVFSNLTLFKSDYTDGSGNITADPDGCGICGCASSYKGTWADVIGLTFTLDVAGITNGSNNCGDCGTLNGSYVMAYVPGGNPNSGFTGTYSISFDLGPGCVPPYADLTGVISVSFNVAGIVAGICGNNLAVGGMLPTGYNLGIAPSGVGGIDVGPDITDTTTMNSKLVSALASGYTNGILGVSVGQCNPATLISPTNFPSLVAA